MVSGWIFEDNLQAFVLAIAQFAGYTFGDRDWQAVIYGIEGSDEEAGRWFDYDLPGLHCIRFWLASDPGTTVIHARVEAPAAVEPKVEAALLIFQCFHLKADG